MPNGSKIVDSVDGCSQTIGTRISELDCFCFVIDDVKRSRRSERLLVEDVMRAFHPCDDGWFQGSAGFVNKGIVPCDELCTVISRVLNEFVCMLCLGLVDSSGD